MHTYVFMLTYSIDNWSNYTRKENWIKSMKYYLLYKEETLILDFLLSNIGPLSV